MKQQVERLSYRGRVTACPGIPKWDQDRGRMVRKPCGDVTADVTTAYEDGTQFVIANGGALCSTCSFQEQEKRAERRAKHEAQENNGNARSRGDAR